MIQYFIKTIKDKRINQIPEFQNGCLVYVVNPPEEELIFLTNKFFLDLNILKDAQDLYEIPRIEIKNNFKYVFLRVPDIATKELTTHPFLFVISPNFTLLLSQKKLEFLEKFIIQENLNTTQKNKLFLNLLSKICEVYNDSIVFINKEIRKTGLEIEKIKESDIENFVHYEISLQDFMNALVPIKHIFNNLLQKGYLELFEEDKELIEDLILKINQLEDISKSNIKNITHIREAFEILLNNKVNKAIKILTGLTIIFAAPTLIASLYGMNLELPLAQNPFAFWIIIIINLIIILILAVIFKFLGWF